MPIIKENQKNIQWLKNLSLQVIDQNSSTSSNLNTYIKEGEYKFGTSAAIWKTLLEQSTLFAKPGSHRGNISMYHGNGTHEMIQTTVIFQTAVIWSDRNSFISYRLSNGSFLWKLHCQVPVLVGYAADIFKKLI